MQDIKLCTYVPIMYRKVEKSAFANIIAKKFGYRNAANKFSLFLSMQTAHLWRHSPWAPLAKAYPVWMRLVARFRLNRRPHDCDSPRPHRRSSGSGWVPIESGDWLSAQTVFQLNYLKLAINLIRLLRVTSAATVVNYIIFKISIILIYSSDAGERP